jgi:thermitase
MIEKVKPLIERIKGNVQRINPKSPVFIAAAGFVLVLLLTFVFTLFNVGSRQDEKDEIATLSPTPIPAKDLTPGRDYVPGQLIVKFKEGVSQNEINQTLAKYNASVKTTITGINSTVISIPPGEEDSIRKSLSSESIVKYAELDHVAHAITNDTRFGELYGIKNTGQNIRGAAGTAGADSKLEPAWEVTKGSGVKIAVLDTGIDMNHQDLASKVTDQKVFITSSIDDQFGHGTHVAGTAAAVTNNSTGIAGTCPDCTMIIGKVLDDTGNGPYSVIAQGITWAADSQAKVINMSLGGYSADNTLAEAAAYAWDKGSIIVAAAGNNNTTNKFYPGANANVVTVAATNNKDKKASFSNFGDWVEVAAAGENILSTFPTHPYVGQNSWKTALNYDYISGTSMATPLVSGVVGLLWSSSYGTSKEAVVDRLYATADKITGTGSSWTKGRVNAQAAVGGSGNPSPSPSTQPSVGPTSGLTPTGPAPTFVCGGSPDSICTSPSPTGRVTTTPRPSISQGPDLTGAPTITPVVTPIPGDDCLDPRSTPEKIQDWIKGFLKKINDFIQIRLGNPTDPTPPPTPCIKQ